MASYSVVFRPHMPDTTHPRKYCKEAPLSEIFVAALANFQRKEFSTAETNGAAPEEGAQDPAHFMLQVKAATQ